MKKWMLILGVLAALAVLLAGVAPAYAQGMGNAGKSVKPSCDEWLMGRVLAKSGDAGNGTIRLESQQGDIEVNISVNGDTVHKAWMASWEVVTFNSLAVGDWIAACTKDGIAKRVILLKSPQSPLCIRIAGNVTAVNGGQVTVTTDDGDTYTIGNLSKAGVDKDIKVGEPVRLTIGRCVPFFGRYFPGLHLGWFIGEGNQGAGPQGVGPWIKNKDFQGKLEKFRENYRERFEQRFQRWQERFGD